MFQVLFKGKQRFEHSKRMKSKIEKNITSVQISHFKIKLKETKIPSS